MKRLYGTTDPTEAEMIRILLRQEGIESDLDNEGGAAYAIGFPTAAVPLGINVRDEDAENAVTILGRYFEKQAKEEEPDPEAPEPLTPAESIEFEKKVRRARPHRRILWAMAFLLPNAIAPICFSLGGEYEIGGIVALTLMGILGIAWGLHKLFRKAKKPAP